MNEKIRVLVFDVSGNERDTLVNMLNNVEYIVLDEETENFQEAERQIEDHDIDVVLVGADVEDDGYEIVERLYEKFSDIAIIILEGEINEESLHRAFFVGAKDIIYSPYKLENVIDSIYKAYQNIKSPTNKINKSESRIKKKTGIGQLYTVFGAKGGIGKTFIALNMAVMIKKITGKRVALVDLDLELGNISLALNIKPESTISDLLDDIRNIDQEYIESYLIAHESGISVLASGSMLMSDEYVHSEDIEVILQILKTNFDYVIVDMPSRFDEKINPTFLISDKIFIVITPEVAALRNTKMAMVTLEDLRIQKAKIFLLLNKVEKKDMIRKKDVEETLNKEVFASFTLDNKNALSSINLGTPVVLNKSARIFESEFTNFVNHILETKQKIK